MGLENAFSRSLLKLSHEINVKGDRKKWKMRSQMILFYYSNVWMRAG